MARHVRLRELLIGVEGLALLRHLYDGTGAAANRRLAEVGQLFDDRGFSAGELTCEADPRTGYRAWAERYDEPGNPIVALEQPAVWSLVGSLAPGRASPNLLGCCGQAVGWSFRAPSVPGASRLARPVSGRARSAKVRPRAHPHPCRLPGSVCPRPVRRPVTVMRSSRPQSSG